jgi:hypothetical protein
MQDEAVRANIEEPAPLERERKHFEALKRAVADIGLFRRGNLVRVLVRCGKKNCGCATDPAKRHGPYVQWTRKVGGRTVSERVGAEQVPLLEEWLRNARDLDRLLSQMQQVSLRATRRILGQRGEHARRK